MVVGVDALGLPDPSDYSPPTNGDQRHPSLVTSEARADGFVGQDTFPPPAPSVAGDEVTESVYQQGV